MNRNNRVDASRAGSSFYLVEIQYYFRLETGQVTSSSLLTPL
jgi:hypothetical protein